MDGFKITIKAIIKPAQQTNYYTNANDSWLNANQSFLQVQSEEHMTGKEPGHTETHVQQNIRFDDAELNEDMDYSTPFYKSLDQDVEDTAGLSSFLSRPVKINTTTWTEGAFLNASFKPWTLFFNNAVIKRKLENYSRLRCTLKLKFVINASPFYFGIVRACYFPYATNIVYSTTDDQVLFSQTPGVYLEPSKMSAADMKLPFLWPLTFIDVNQQAHFDQMGTLQFLEYTGLRSANGVAGTGVTITTFAWAEDIQLSGPTTALAIQADEYQQNQGVISAPATTVANIASMLGKAPVIGSFAKATEIGARGVASIAKLFGYSNPPIIQDVMPYQPKSFHAFANVETRVPIDKLSLDPKNEVTIDNSIIGAPKEDPLSFENTVFRESFVRGTLWTGSYIPSTPIFTAVVNPAQLVKTTSGLLDTHYYTPMSYFGELFNYWRGSLIYKFKFVKSKYHKGRVIVSWDPETSLIGVTDPETAVFSRVIDLEYEDEVEIEIPYKAISPFLEVFHSDSVTNSTSPSLTLNPKYHNGSLQMRVLNVLTGPAISPEIDVLMYVRPGKDFQYARPKAANNALTTLPIQGDEENITEESKPLDTRLNDVTMGEIISSLRPLLHRTSYSFTQLLGGPQIGSSSYVGSGHQFNTNIINRLPRPYGYDTSNGYHWAQEIVGAGNSQFNYVANHPIRWVLNCFVGYRGSVNVHINPISTERVPYIDSIEASRYYGSTVLSSTTKNINKFTITSPQFGESTLSRAATTYQSTYTEPVSRKNIGVTGTSLTNTKTQSALSVNVPQYSKFKFYTAPYSTSLDETLPDYSQFYDNVRISSYFITGDATSSTTSWPAMDVYYAAGVDFMPVYFVCVPRIYEYGGPTAVDSYNP